MTSVINNRREFCLGPIHYAANLLDPRFRGRILTEEETVAAEDKILAVANIEDLPADEVAADLLAYRTQSGTLFSSTRFIWNISYNTDPLTWWKGYAASQPLSSVAVILLSMSATSAAVERTNKEFGLQKTKLRNRPSR